MHWKNRKQKRQTEDDLTEANNLKMKNNFIIRWLCGYLIFFNSSCIQNENIKIVEANFAHNKSINTCNEKLQNLIAVTKKLIEPGDIITRTGNDFTSQSLKTLNRKDKTFSHCGIANIENDSLFIYHAIGGEWNPDQKIRRESFEVFINPEENNLMGIYRFMVEKNIKEYLIRRVKHLYQANILFDMDFDLKTDDKMYCSEFVYKSITQASDKKIIFNHSFINDFEFVGVDDITQHLLSKKIALVDYRLY